MCRTEEQREEGEVRVCNVEGERVKAPLLD